MNFDIRVDTSFQHHHKTLALAHELGPAGPLCLIYLWLWTANNRPNGDLSGIPHKVLETACGWREYEGDADAGRMVRACITVGFLDVTSSGGLLIHDWLEHNSFAATGKERSAAAHKAAAARWNKYAAKPKTKRMRAASEAHANSNAKGNARNVTLRSVTKHKETEELQAADAAHVDVSFVKALQKHAATSWEAAHGEKAPWGKADFVCLASAASRFRSLEVAVLAWDLFLAERREFYAGHSPGKFLHTVSEWVEKAAKAAPVPATSTPSGCQKCHAEQAVNESGYCKPCWDEIAAVRTRTGLTTKEWVEK